MTQRWVCQRWIILLIMIPVIWAIGGHHGHHRFQRKCPFEDTETHECCYKTELNITVPMNVLVYCSDVPTTTPAIAGPVTTEMQEDREEATEENHHEGDHEEGSGSWRKRRSASFTHKGVEYCFIETNVTVRLTYGELRCCDGWKRARTWGTCSVETDEPYPTICLNGGNATSDGKCQCKTGFVGLMCEFPVCNPACLNQGQCAADEGKPVCVCYGGRFTGKRCETPVCPRPCKNGGECKQVGLTTECICAPGFEGETCQHAIKPGTCPVAKKQYYNCYDSCHHDADCNDDKKCCYNGCGRSCQDPVTTECTYKGKSYPVGTHFIDGNCKTCTCLNPGADGLQCTDITCPTLNCQSTSQESDQCCPFCRDHGEPTGTGPKFRHCPANVTVYLQHGSKQANLKLSSSLQLEAVDSTGRVYDPEFSATHLNACACNDTRQNYHHVLARSEPDKYGRYDICTFSAKVVDPFPPKFVSCPSPIEALWDEQITWPPPEVTDNVGVQSLTLVTSHLNNTLFGIGEFIVVYIAKDYDGNEAVCRFMVEVYHPSSKFLPPRLWSKRDKVADVTVMALVCAIIGSVIILSSVSAYALRRCKKSRDGNSPESATDETELEGAHAAPPPAYECIMKNGLPEYIAEPPVYEQLTPAPVATKAGLVNPMYTVAEDREEVVETKVPLEDLAE